jgi:hypothetical protein
MDFNMPKTKASSMSQATSPILSPVWFICNGHSDYFLNRLPMFKDLNISNKKTSFPNSLYKS